MRLWLSLSLTFILLGFQACSQTQWSSFADVDSEGMDPLEVIEFRPEVDNPAREQRYDLILALRYDRESAPDTIWLKLSEESLSWEREREGVIAIPLRNEDGSHSGKGTHNLLRLEKRLRSSFLLPDGYSIAVSAAPGRPVPVSLNNVGVLLKLKIE